MVQEGFLTTLEGLHSLCNIEQKMQFHCHKQYQRFIQEKLYGFFLCVITPLYGSWEELLALCKDDGSYWEDLNAVYVDFVRN